MDNEGCRRASYPCLLAKVVVFLDCHLSFTAAQALFKRLLIDGQHFAEFVWLDSPAAIFIEDQLGCDPEEAVALLGNTFSCDV